jgi:hypothetical protein
MASINFAEPLKHNPLRENRQYVIERGAFF